MREICMSGSMSGVWRRGHGRASKAPPDERGGNRYVRPTATAPHLDSTEYGGSRGTPRTVVQGGEQTLDRSLFHESGFFAQSTLLFRARLVWGRFFPEAAELHARREADDTLGHLSLPGWRHGR